jgi:hypothetical protein
MMASYVALGALTLWFAFCTRGATGSAVVFSLIPVSCSNAGVLSLTPFSSPSAAISMLTVVPAKALAACRSAAEALPAADRMTPIVLIDSPRAPARFTKSPRLRLPAAIPSMASMIAASLRSKLSLIPAPPSR